MTRRKGDYSYDKEESKVVGQDVLSLMIHGDAAIAGQGINQEILTMANLPHFTVGGSLHFTIDNQVLCPLPSPGE